LIQQKPFSPGVLTGIVTINLCEFAEVFIAGKEIQTLNYTCQIFDDTGRATVAKPTGNDISTIVTAYLSKDK